MVCVLNILGWSDENVSGNKENGDRAAAFCALEDQNNHKTKKMIYPANLVSNCSETWKVNQRTTSWKYQAVETDFWRSWGVFRLHCIRNENIKRWIHVDKTTLDTININQTPYWYVVVEWLPDDNWPKKANGLTFCLLAKTVKTGSN